MKNIVILGQSNYNWLWLALAKRLKDEHKCKIHFICVNPQSVKYWKAQDTQGVVDTFVTTNHFFYEYDKPAGPLEDVSRIAAGYESKYKTYLVDVLQTDRHLGRGFFPAGIGHPKSRLSSKSDYKKSLSLFNKVVKFWEDYFDTKTPDLVIGIASGIIGKTCIVVAKAKGIQVRDLALSRYESYFYWAEDEYYFTPRIEEEYRKIQDPYKEVSEDELVSLRRLPEIEKYYNNFMQYRSFGVFLKRIAKQIKMEASRRVKGIVNMGNYMLSENIRYIWKVYRDINAMDRLKMSKTSDLQNIPYVFYPLHIEPETAMGLLSPEFNEQLALIELIAKNLPAGVFLVVKEHIGAIGRRPKEFYSTILEIPNVIMIPTYEYAIEVAKNARCVAAITSTVGLEAAILGVPVVSFGMHNSFNFLPHVKVIDSWMALRGVLAHMCNLPGNDAIETRKRNGIKFLAALKLASFDMNFSDHSSKSRPSATHREVEAVYSALTESLRKKEKAGV